MGGVQDGSLSRYDVRKKKTSSTGKFPNKHSGAVAALCVQPHPQKEPPFLLSAGADGAVVIWDCGTGAEPRARYHLEGVHAGTGIDSMATDPVSNCLYTVAYSGGMLGSGGSLAQIGPIGPNMEPRVACSKLGNSGYWGRIASVWHPSRHGHSLVAVNHHKQGELLLHRGDVPGGGSVVGTPEIDAGALIQAVIDRGANAKRAPGGAADRLDINVLSMACHTTRSGILALGTTEGFALLCQEPLAVPPCARFLSHTPGGSSILYASEDNRIVQRGIEHRALSDAVTRSAAEFTIEPYPTTAVAFATAPVFGPVSKILLSWDGTFLVGGSPGSWSIWIRESGQTVGTEDADDIALATGGEQGVVTYAVLAQGVVGVKRLTQAGDVTEVGQIDGILPGYRLLYA